MNITPTLEAETLGRRFFFKKEEKEENLSLSLQLWNKIEIPIQYKYL